MSMTETINNPSHYGGADNPYEAIKVIDAWRCNFNTGNAYKYMARAGFKTVPGQTLDEKRAEDYGKARWYLQHQLDTVLQPDFNEGANWSTRVEYEFHRVFIEVGFACGLRSAVLACLIQLDPVILHKGIQELTELIEGLKT